MCDECEKERPEVRVISAEGKDAGEIMAEIFGHARKPEPFIPTMEDIAQANLTMQENMRPMLGTAAFIRTELMEQGFSEMAAEQTASNFFLGSVLQG